MTIAQPIPLAATGAPLEASQATMIMLHGRGASARDILGLAAEFILPGWAYVAPQAPGNTWYPYSFLEPLERNEPQLSAALSTLGQTVEQVRAAGVPAERIVLLGFSQGACLSLEWAARNARRLGGVAGLSGGLVGPQGAPRDYAGSLAGTPILLGCSDIDPHIPLWRVRESAAVLGRIGGQVTERIYPAMGHNVNQDEIAWVRALLERISAS